MFDDSGAKQEARAAVLKIKESGIGAAGPATASRASTMSRDGHEDVRGSPAVLQITSPRQGIWAFGLRLISKGHDRRRKLRKNTAGSTLFRNRSGDAP